MSCVTIEVVLFYVNSPLLKARMVRDTAHQGGISDEERRKRAADMATRFAEMMLPPGEMDSSDDDN